MHPARSSILVAQGSKEYLRGRESQVLEHVVQQRMEGGDIAVTGGTRFAGRRWLSSMRLTKGTKKARSMRPACRQAGNQDGGSVGPSM